MAQPLHIGLQGPFTNLPFGIRGIYFDLKVIIPMYICKNTHVFCVLGLTFQIPLQPPIPTFLSSHIAHVHPTTWRINPFSKYLTTMVIVFVTKDRATFPF